MSIPEIPLDASQPGENPPPAANPIAVPLSTEPIRIRVQRTSKECDADGVSVTHPREFASWAEFAEFVTQIEPVDTGNDDLSVKAKRGLYKDRLPMWSPHTRVPGDNRRTGDGVEAVTVVVLDVDGVAAETVNAAMGPVAELGLACAVAPSFSHADNDHPRIRICIPVHEPVPFCDWSLVYAAVRHFFGGIADPTCKDVSRGYWHGGTPAENFEAGKQWCSYSLGGHALNWRAVLAQTPAHVLEKARRRPTVSAPADPFLARCERRREAFGLPEEIHEVGTPGADQGRHGTLTSYGAHLREFGFSRDEIERELLAVNLERCKPEPKPDHEIESIADWCGDLTAGLPPEARELTEAGLAERFAARYANRARCIRGGGWLVWNGRVWESAHGRPTELFMDMCRDREREYLEDMERKGEDPDEKFLKLIKAQRSASKANAVLSLAERLGSIPVDRSALDADAWALNTPSGIVDLRTGELGPHDPDALCTKLTGASFDPDAECPRWRQFVDEITCEDRELAGYLQRAVGLSLVGEQIEHVMFFAHGAGSNGKGVMFQTLTKVCGDYAAQAVDDLLLKKRGDGRHKSELAMLHGRRLLFSAEVEENRSWDEARIKGITGGDPITANHMRENPFTFVPAFTLFVSGNNRPVVHGTDDGIWRRMRLIPFAASFLGKEDRNLPGKLEGEGAGILAWAVEGLRLYSSEGLAEPKCVTEATKAYREDQDGLGQFLDERCDLGEGKSVNRTILYRAYRAWCEDQDATPKRAKGFREDLCRRKGIAERKTDGARLVTGLALRLAAGAEANPFAGQTQLRAVN